MNRTIRVSAAGAVLTFPLRNSGGLSECAAVFRDLSGEMHTSGASAGRAWYGQGKCRKKYSVCGRRKNSRKNCRISHPREQEIWNRMGIQRRKDCTSCVKNGKKTKTQHFFTKQLKKMSFLVEQKNRCQSRKK